MKLSEIKTAYTVFISKWSILKPASSFGHALKGQPQRFIGPLRAEVAGFYYSDPLIRLVPPWVAPSTQLCNLSLSLDI